MLRGDGGWVATLCGIASALGYMAANVCLRSVTELDPFWVSQMKALPTVAVVGPLVALRLVRGQGLVPSTQMLGVIGGIALLGQVGGNVAFQWSLGIVGIALAVPLTLGTMITAGALLGWLILGDRVSKEMTIASGILLIAIIVLSLGAGAANASVVGLSASGFGSGSWYLVVAGVLAACLAGASYSCLSVTLRYCSNRGAPVASLLFLVGLAGFVVLGAIVAMRHGIRTPWITTSPRDYAYLLGAGTFNLVAFASLTKALQLSSVVFVNALNASQTALAALAGVVLFGEAFTLTMATGVTLTAIGLLWMRPRKKPHPSHPPMTAHSSSR
jgi:drug/metabolite transporter (DMT)-like permease